MDYFTGRGPPSMNPIRDNGRRNSGRASSSLVTVIAATLPHPSQHPQSQAIRQPAGVSIPSGGLYIISHSSRIQGELDRLGIPWGAQYELARGESHGHWTWDDVTLVELECLVGLNAEAAPKVASLMLQTQRSEPVDDVVWAEYDREQEAIAEDHDSRRSLGVYGDWAPWHKGPGEDWYGGRISQCARVVEEAGQFKVFLDPPAYQKTTSRFARFLGSRRMLRLTIPPGIHQDRLRSFLARKFVLCGRVFVALRRKESKSGKPWKVYLIEVNEDVDRYPEVSEGDQSRLTFQEFVRWHNPIQVNNKQPISKWITRFDLGLSPTIPVVEFDPRNVEFVHDTYPFGIERTDIRPQRGELIADGCGFMNRKALDLVAQHAGWSEFKCAAQGRLGGSKGVWLLHPDHQLPDDSPPRVWIRDSQKKISHEMSSGPGDGRSRAYFIFDLVAPARLVYPSRLNKQTITNLSSNGVPTSVFAGMLEAAVQKDFEDLTTWEGEEAMEFLSYNVMRLGSVAGIRTARKAGTMARIQGLRGREIEDIPLSQASDLESGEGGQESDMLSGPPSVLSEKIYDMIIAGFHPLRSEVLYGYLGQFILNVIRAYVYECKIPIPQSCEAFIVPDPFGLLEPNEIYFRASQNIVEGLGGVNSDTVTGPILINRNPTMLPSDMQRVIAVDKYHDTYKQYRDVIVCSVKGEQSLASKLAGGDYDGDTAMLTWKPEIISAFQQPRLNAVPQGFLAENFDQQLESLDSFSAKISAMGEAEAEREMHRVFVESLQYETRTGIYSNFHNASLYERGYAHPETLRLAHMSNTCLDSQKTGLRVRDAVFKADSKKYNKILPESLSKDGDDSKEGTRPVRPARLGEFVLDALLEHGKKIWKDHNDKYKKLRSRMITDHDLLRPYEEARACFTSPPHSEQLMILERHVQGCRSDWAGLGSSARAPASPNAKARADTKQKQSLTVAKIRKQFATGPPPEQMLDIYSFPRGSRMVREIKASFAYLLGERFALEVAFHDICALKASANEGEYPVHGKFRDTLMVSSSVARRYNAQNASRRAEQG
ncbi:hypothetical protein BDM02DRAFT_3108435 [Thelephora ganbajun]|uniref:Uncharacterized protein n=1 Tax=Thelephora ganbajun TaxID=370292 RepID=A0ACB6ZT52_THEGA|nr:hypothetical protein BDM02DRAFT_3108435 [Thelephora ganbajun]